MNVAPGENLSASRGSSENGLLNGVSGVSYPFGGNIYGGINKAGVRNVGGNVVLGFIVASITMYYLLLLA